MNKFIFCINLMLDKYRFVTYSETPKALIYRRSKEDCKGFNIYVYLDVNNKITSIKDMAKVQESSL